MSTPTVEMPFTHTPTNYQHKISSVDGAEPLQWLISGFNDFKSVPGLSLLYGLLFTSLTAGVFLLVMNIPWYSIAYLTGLVVMGPFMASGLYAASRDIQQGRQPSINSSLRQLIKRSTDLALFATLLSLVMAAWVRISALLFAVKFNTLNPSIEAYTSLFSSSEGWITLSFFVGIGFLLALSVFIISAVAIPMILDKGVNFITAMQTSYQAVTKNPGPMAIWAAFIVAITAVGMMTAFIGFVVLFPILGYATWHSYRSLVK
jgi:uncharacterized membrane protein